MIQPKEIESEMYNMHYLAGHGLIELKVPNHDRVPAATITSRGLDYLENDGGLSAILGVVVVRLDEDTLKALLLEKLEEADEPESVKEKVRSVLIGLLAKAVDQAATHMIEKGTRWHWDSRPVAILRSRLTIV